jgi:hypothetical protein
MAKCEHNRQKACCRDCVLIDDGLCPVFGTSYDLSPKEAPSGSTASIDKFIPSLGYVKGNCSVISNLANVMKQNATIEQVRLLLAWMEKRVQK